MFVNFKNIVDSFHPKLPFGLAQIGKAFRNEITPRDFIFRVRDFEQMEIEYFLEEKNWKEYFDYWKGEMILWMELIGIDMQSVYELEVEEADRAHYSSRTIDFEFDFPFGRSELYGLAYRSDFDLSSHSNGSSVDLSYFDEETKSKIPPHVIEPTFGVERTFLALMVSAYKEEINGEEVRPYLAFKPSVAPVICAVSPLLKNKPELRDYAHLVYRMLKDEFGRVMWDDNGNIGKRYRRQDEIGTPWCIVIDFDTLSDDTVTIRDRDTGKQERIKKEDIVAYIKERMN
jgi:glycyl-tRNA synthetase